jgi:phosphatidylglycerol:prolipoprotein diacylglycerol transferase
MREELERCPADCYGAGVLPWIKAAAFLFPTPIPLPGFEQGIPMHPFALLVMTGALASVRAADWYARKNRLSPAVIGDLTVHMLFFGFVGASVFNTLFYYPERMLEVLESPRHAARLYSGISSYGGFLGGVLGSLIWRRRRKLPLLELGDATAFAAPFGWLFGRSGCAVAHDHPGGVTNFFLGIREWDGTPYTRHDLGFYEVLWSAAVMALLMVLVQRKRTPGFYVALVPTLYAPYRFLLDFLRIDAALPGGDARYAGLTPAQYAAVGTMIMALMVLRHSLTEPAPELPEFARIPAA